MDKEKINWRTFANQGTINKIWSNPGTPTYYILDENGVIRHKWTGYPGQQALDGALEALIKKLESKSR